MAKLYCEAILWNINFWIMCFILLYICRKNISVLTILSFSPLKVVEINENDTILKYTSWLMLVFTTASIVWWTDEQERILCLSFSFHNLGTTYSNPWACIILTDLLGFKSVMGSSLYITCDIFLSIIVICLPSFISSLLYPIAIVCQMNYFTD